MISGGRGECLAGGEAEVITRRRAALKGGQERADGEPHITILSDALVYHNGLIVWKPPSIYKSFCPINIEYFPYDSQSCSLKFGGWSYNGFLLDVRQLPSIDSPIINREDETGKEYQYLEKGMDLSGFYQSLEWDLMSLTSQRHEQLTTEKDSVLHSEFGDTLYADRYQLETFGIPHPSTSFAPVQVTEQLLNTAILTTFVFYIPPIEHKMTFSISILVSLTVFYLVLIELIPPTSLVIPLIGRYLLFTMFLVAMSILLSVLSLNYYRRSTNEAETIVQELNEAGRRIELQINTRKTLFMKNASCGDGEAQREGSEIAETSSSVHLRPGHSINMENDLKEQLNRWMGAVWAAIAPIRGTRNDQLTYKSPCSFTRLHQLTYQDLRVNLFNSSILPTKTDAAATFKKLRTTLRALEKCLLKSNQRKQHLADLNSSNLRIGYLKLDNILDDINEERNDWRRRWGSTFSEDGPSK
ncbi:hypothetical protein RB195_023801 [Necator americanus]|uniref:Neurotransmitter-gated ion-channel ligand binding domain protein n=1 Tax=Necator americanus TaxID=51031 RepID=A0ABR1EKL9_NECAM